ncbi:phosphotransferase family protein [Streptomyces sp. 142MFCol3.1]|uniref:phosphotransferase family protein n=1 Tax=Streptomyces sp. 142MFCol3.1 TaxID=1172179 RepID=UPI00048D75E4|nr:aminoglycoside phosphotransferase family protein [Streptomyces sp. 142MFCol3.1]
MRIFAGAEDLSAVVREALGEDCRIVGADRLRGGSKKGVYRVRLAGAGPASVIVYSWAQEKNFWPGTADDDGADPFARASGLMPFLAAQRELAEIGACVPRVLWADGSGRRYGADVAVVEDIPGGTLEALFETDPARAATALDHLAGTLRLMHRHQASRYGRVDLLEGGGVSVGESCEQVVLDRALRDLDEAAGRDARIESVRTRLDDRLRELRALVAPRGEFGLIHGELGPDHVLVNPEGQAVLIDIEGLMFFDIEWEHVFLSLRFGERYPVLARPGLDRRRLDLYMTAMRLSLVAGPLRLLDGDFPDREFMRGIAEHNLRETLALLP